MGRGVWALLPTPRLVSLISVSLIALFESIWDYKTLNDKESRNNMTIYEKSHPSGGDVNTSSLFAEFA